MVGTSPTSRTLKVMREVEGADVCIVERYNSFSHTRHDAFNMFDLLAIRGGDIVGVQVTSASNHAARRTKIVENPLAVKWVLAGGLIEVRTWKKVKNRWVERVEKIEP